ncbi:MAG: transglutaminase domain-containing protein [Clostridia bacterium]|nr:transglutaminase domain-containing protein [Clostridia bacterium]
MMKFIKRLIVFSAVLFVLVYAVNSETDFFKSFDTNFPGLAENAPVLSSAAAGISDTFSKLPSISQLIEHFTKEEMPMTPDTFAENAYIKDSPLLNFFENESIGIIVNEGKSITVFGLLGEIARSNLALQLNDKAGNTVYETTFAADTSFQFTKTVEIPQTDAEKLSVEIYTGEKKYGNYQGFVNSYVYLVKNDGLWELYKSPVSEQNDAAYSQKRSVTKALKATDSIQSENKSIKSVAQQLTADCQTEYDKTKAIHDWICTYLHYDNDSLSKSNIAPYSATEVLKSRKAVCLGFANLYAALCRSIGIPCSVVTGYALGISSGSSEWTEKIVSGNEENHAWNEVYVDGRWIIVDSTWDTFNSYENGEMKKGGHISHLYFDANIDFFSANHKIMHYDE